MDEKNVKKLLINFENASKQLEEALQTMQNFSKNLDEYFEVSDATLKTIDKVNAVDFDAPRIIVNEINSNLEGLQKAMYEVKSAVESHSDVVKKNTARLSKIDMTKIEKITETNIQIQKDLEDIKNTLALLGDKIDAMAKEKYVGVSEEDTEK